MTKTEKIQRKKARLDMYLERERFMLSPDGVQSYGIGSKNVQRYNTDLGRIQQMISTLEDEIEELEGAADGHAPRRMVGIVPRD